MALTASRRSLKIFSLFLDFAQNIIEGAIQKVVQKYIPPPTEKLPPLTSTREKISVAEALRTHKKRLVPGDAYWTTMQEQFGYDEEGIIPELPIPVGDSEPSSSNQTVLAIQRRSGNSTQARRSGPRRRGRPTSATRPTRGSRRGRGRSRATHRRRIQLAY